MSASPGATPPVPKFTQPGHVAVVQLPATGKTLATVRAVLAAHAEEPGALLPVLHGVQDALGCVPPNVVPEIAGALNLSRAEVHGVITYYHHFRQTKPARHVLQVCRAEACQALGADKLLAHAQTALGCGVHEHSADGAVTLEPAYCLGLCASSPAIQIDDELHARVTPERLDELLAPLRARKTGSAA